MSSVSLYPDQQTLTIGAALTALTESLGRVGAESPAVSAQWLMEDLSGVPRLALADHADQTLSSAHVARYRAIADRVERAEPLQYILGHAAFMDLELACDRRALIPRPETETLLATIFADYSTTDQARPAVIDVGTGSGCIALAIAAKWRNAQITAIDLHQEALALAKENAVRLDLSDRIRWQQGDLLEGVPPESADLIIANLPYIATPDWLNLSSEVRLHEPRSALDAGPMGTELLCRLIDQALTVLRSGGRIYLEIGSDQGDAIKEAMRSKGFVAVAVKPDLVGRDRMVKGIRR